MRRLREKEKAEIANDYNAGVGIREMKRCYHRDRLTIMRVVDEFGITRRPSCYDLSGVRKRFFGQDNPKWKGGIRIKSGRRYILKREHPQADKKGYVPQSRLVMEKKLGRFLLPGEIVHHINGDILDDRPENLELFPSNGSHTGFHNRLRAYSPRHRAGV